ncbi:MAG TPA: cystatin family protein [Candidatus Kapabacteria bacterium]|nr:cystatin family protein [Candidatus Kapabacteria bacterium]
MKKVSRITPIIAVMLAVLSYSVGHAQQVGAYSDVSVKDAEVRKAAQFAVTERNKAEKTKLVSIVSARQQVVSGMNYDLVLKLRSGKTVRKAKVIVWHRIDGSYHLGSWDWVPEPRQ